MATKCGQQPLRLAVLDMAGTTIADDGLVERAFAEAFASQGVPAGSPAHEAMMERARLTMGTARISVFNELLPPDQAARANSMFESAYDRIIAESGVAAVAGAETAISELRDAGMQVCLTTGFARRTQNRILESLGWMGLADLSLCPDDAGRGRPFPDMILTAVLALDLPDVREVLVVGDSRADMLAGRRAGSRAVVGVLTGAHREDALRAAGADVVVPSIREVPALVRAAAPVS